MLCLHLEYRTTLEEEFTSSFPNLLRCAVICKAEINQKDPCEFIIPEVLSSLGFLHPLLEKQPEYLHGHKAPSTPTSVVTISRAPSTTSDILSVYRLSM